jgi:ribosomal protein RSM22 (predicted rRNA methylase)
MNESTIDKLIKHARILYPGANLKPSHIGEYVSKLSDNFVKSAQPDDYLNSIDVYIAYLLYFMPVNMLKLPYLLNEIDFSSHKTIKILDCGTGTGTFALSAVDFSHNYPNIELDITLTDKAISHIDKTRKLFGSMLETGDISANAINYHTMDLVDIDNLKNKYNLIILGNIINEIDIAKYPQILKKLNNLLENNGSIIMIEPALKELSQKALHFRDEAINYNLFPIFPCIQTIEKPSLCPALLDNDWCHQTHSIYQNKWISGIDRHTGFLKDDIRYTGIIFSKHKKIDDANSWRVVSDMMGEKGLSKAYLCHDDNRILARRLDKNKSDNNSKWSRLKKGDMLTLQENEYSNNKINISKNTVIEVKKL